MVKKTLSDKRQDNSQCAKSWDYSEEDVKQFIKDIKKDLFQTALSDEGLQIYKRIEEIIKKRAGERLA